LERMLYFDFVDPGRIHLTRKFDIKWHF